jgi:hypothetical protein
MGTIKTTNIEPIADNGTVTLGSSGDTITIPSGVTMVNNGTQTGFGGANTPYFYARRGTNQDSVSNDTSTKVQFNTEDFDTGNEYDNSTNYRFVPANGNTYLIHAQIQFAASSNTILQEARTKLYKNGSEILEMRNDGYTTNFNKTAPSLSRVVTGNGSDYYEIYGRGYLSSSGTIKFGGGSFFTAFKLIS